VTAQRRDALNLLSFLVILSACLAIAIYAGLRVTRLDGRFTPLGLGGPVLQQAGAAQRPPATPADGERLALLPDQPGVVNHGDRSTPSVALTFDAEMTPQMIHDVDRGTVARYVNDGVLAELRSMQVPATFFLSGQWMERYPDVARDIGGTAQFEVASNSYGNQSFRPGCFQLATLDLSRAADDLERSQTLLSGVSARPTPYFRFPGGCYNDAAVAAVQAAGAQVVQYDVVAGDTNTLVADTVVAHTVSSARNGSIIVLHVTGGNSAPVTDRALPEIVRQLRFRGFTLVRVSDLLRVPR
jgi:peptidoglycan/xylan/chitin deacetylase (PgdA/CDA1 family)